MDEIADAAGISPRTFFRYFPTKAQSYGPTSAGSATGSCVLSARGPPTKARHGAARSAARDDRDACRGPGTDRAPGTTVVQRERGDRRRRRLRSRPGRPAGPLVAEHAGLDPTVDLRPPSSLRRWRRSPSGVPRVGRVGRNDDLTTIGVRRLGARERGFDELDHRKTERRPSRTARQVNANVAEMFDLTARSPSSPVAVEGSAQRSSGATQTQVPTSSSPVASSITAPRSPSGSRRRPGEGRWPVGCHVARWDDCDRLSTRVRGFGRCDVFVNNAGMSPLYPDLSRSPRSTTTRSAA